MERDDITPHWFLAQCKPRECFRAQRHLEEQAYTTYLPTQSVKRKHARRVYWQTEPLFPHYLFLQTPMRTNWSALRSTRGISRVVSFNGAPMKVDEGIVQALRQQCDILNGLEPEPLFRHGEKVIITDGCFRELEAIVETTRGDERVVLLLNLLNRQQTVELPITAIASR